MNCSRTSNLSSLPARAAAVLLLLLPGSLFTADTAPVPAHVAQLLARATRVDGNLRQVSQSVEPARFRLGPEGALRDLRAPLGHEFPVAGPGRSDPETVVRRFLKQNAIAFGLLSPVADFKLRRIVSRQDRHSVRLDQTYAGLPVHSAQAVVVLGPHGGVEFVLNCIQRDTRLLDEGKVPVTPTLTGEQALAMALALSEAKAPAALVQTTQPELVLFAPAVLGAPGETRLAWKIEVHSDAILSVNKRYLLDAHSGKVLRSYPRVRADLNRRIHDADNGDGHGTLVRAEGDPPTNDDQVDNAYRYFGDAYWFFRDHHGRDSYDGDGSSLEVTVRYCGFDPNNSCANGMYKPGWWLWDDRFYFGQGYVADDVVAHEYTHGVTAHEADFDYENDPGALDESFSDIWGEFVDLTSDRGDDNPAVRWIHGEGCVGSKRNMRHPPNTAPDTYAGAYGCPDRLGAPEYQPPVSDPDYEANDYGGVHYNSGINNKLCYLLTDGDTFNEQSITGVGIDRVADLYYTVNTAMLPSNASFEDLASALQQAAAMTAWTPQERINLYRACVAVEIDGIFVDPGEGCVFQTGTRRCPMWLVQHAVDFASSGEVISIKAGSYNERLTISKKVELHAMDGPVTIGQ